MEKSIARSSVHMTLHCILRHIKNEIQCSPCGQQEKFTYPALVKPHENSAFRQTSAQRNPACRCTIRAAMTGAHVCKSRFRANYII
jgi:hypothetical protein